MTAGKPDNGVQSGHRAVDLAQTVDAMYQQIEQQPLFLLLPIALPLAAMLVRRSGLLAAAPSAARR